MDISGEQQVYTLNLVDEMVNLTSTLAFDF